MKLERIGVIGDVHGEDERLETVLDWFATQNLDAIVCVGDIADGPGDLNRCIELLRGNAVWTVKGNHDEWLLRGAGRDLKNAHALSELKPENLAWLDALPLQRAWETACGPLLLCHGVGPNFMRNLRAEDDVFALRWNVELNQLLQQNRFRVMINGHTHRRCVHRFGSIVNLNAGKLGESGRGSIAGGAWTVDFARERVWLRVFENDALVKPIEMALA